MIEPERLYVKEHSQIPLTVLTGDLESLGERVLTYAMSVHNPETFSNHILIVKGWDEPYLAVESDRLETDRELNQRIAKEERNKAAHEKWLVDRERTEREIYEKLKEKYGDS